MLIVNLTSQSSRGCCVISCFRARLILCFILNFTLKKTKNNSKRFGGLFGQALVKRVCLTRWFQSNTQNITKKLSTVPCNLCRLSYVLLCVFGIYGELFRKNCMKQAGPTYVDQSYCGDKLKSNLIHITCTKIHFNFRLANFSF